MVRLLTGLMFITIFANLSFAQNLQNGQKRWNSVSKLTVDDFKIKISDKNNDAVYSQFMISHSINGFDFAKHNLNRKIENLFLGNASWIDTTNIADINGEIAFQQMQFNLAEIQTRKFRKRILENKLSIAKSFDVVRKIDDEIMTELSEIRLQMMRETESGRDKENIEIWEEKIRVELKKLDEFRFENNKKIKLKK